MTTLLIYTVGGTDAQLVHEGRRWDVSRRARAFREREDWTLGASDLPKAQQCERHEYDDPQSPIVFCTPKLDAVLAHTLEISHALLLVTDRSRDPVFANRVLTKALEQRGIAVTVVPFLSGEEHLEDSLVHDDAVIRREVVARIEGAIRKEIASVRPEQIVIAAVGGLPGVAELVRELVWLHSPHKKDPFIVELEVPDASKGGRQGASADRAVVRSKLDPAGVVAAKRHALALVEQGNFVAAWGAVSHLAKERECKPWVNLLAELAQWASSESTLARSTALPLPRPDQRAANCALRVELALRAGDWPKAIVGTFAFFEAAVRDAVQKLAVLPETPQSPYRLRWAPDANDKTLQDALRARDGSKYEIVCFSSRAEALLAYLSANDPRGCEKLIALADKIAVANDYRNQLAHGEPMPNVVKGAKGALVSAGLWTKNHRFLPAPLIRAVLLELDPTPIDDLADRLMAFVADTLRGTRARSAP